MDIGTEQNWKWMLHNYDLRRKGRNLEEENIFIDTLFKVTHPVVTSFLWLKWQRIRRFFNLNLRFYTLFVACLTWYIFARFAGHAWNGRFIRLDESVILEGENSTKKVDFCSDISDDERGQRIGFWYGAFVCHCVSDFQIFPQSYVDSKDLST